MQLLTAKPLKKEQREGGRNSQRSREMGLKSRNREREGNAGRWEGVGLGGGGQDEEGMEGGAVLRDGAEF